MKKLIIGREAKVDIEGYAKGVPAKIDTGADGSAIWASNIHVNKDNELCFCLFDKKSDFYTGEEIRTKDFSVAEVKSASGHLKLKFCPRFSITIAGVTMKVRFGLCDRSTHKYPILIGRRTLSEKFLVDVSKDEGLIVSRHERSRNLRKKLKENPYKFYKEYYLKEDE